MILSFFLRLCLAGKQEYRHDGVLDRLKSRRQEAPGDLLIIGKPGSVFD
jgi:hypothetical protein